MEVNTHLLIGSTFILVLAILLVLSPYKEASAVSLRKASRKRPPKKEKRVYPRCTTSLRIKYETPIEEGISWIKDISRTGARLFLNKTLEIGTYLRIEINLPHDSQPIFVQGRIVWCKKDDAGFNFDQASQDDIGRIMQYISDREQIRVG